MHSPLHHPPPTTDFFSSGHSTDGHDAQAHKRILAPSGSSHQHVVNDGVIGWSWCQSCRPLAQILLASIAGQGLPSVTTPWALSSPFPDYVCVPALVHRSQLALFAPSSAQPLSPTPPPHEPQPETGEAARTTSAGGRQRKPRGVKIACTNCRLANKKCDEGRPCERCKKNGLEDSCISAERKQRKSRAARQTATAVATINVSGTQVSTERSTISKNDPTTTTVHIAAGASYVDDTQESTDAASHSSPSGSSVTAGDSDSQPDAPAPPLNYALHTNFWASIQPFQATDSGAQFSNWAFNDHDHTPFFSHAMSPTASSDYHGLSPTGLEGCGAFPTGGQRF